jgi:hypothetical protein
MAWIAGRVVGVEGVEARCLREKRARKRCARGADSVVRVLRRERTVGSSAESARLSVLSFKSLHI